MSKIIYFQAYKYNRTLFRGFIGLKQHFSYRFLAKIKKSFRLIEQVKENNKHSTGLYMYKIVFIQLLFEMTAKFKKKNVSEKCHNDDRCMKWNLQSNKYLAAFNRFSSFALLCTSALEWKSDVDPPLSILVNGKKVTWNELYTLFRPARISL